MGKRVLVIGGGLAGIAATVALAERGFSVTLLESRNRLGGRAGSFQDPQTGQLIDTCQHVSMGCCTNFAHLCKTVGVASHLQTQKHLYFMTPDRRVSRFGPDPVPAPLHLLRSFLGVHYFTWAEKARIAWALLALKSVPETEDPPFQAWLEQQRQTPRMVDRFWGLVLVSALNESPDRIGLRYARKVFVDGFMKHRRGFEVELPTVPLGQFYGTELMAWLQQHGVTLELQLGVKSLTLEGERATGVRLRDDRSLDADWVVSAVPFDRLLGFLSEPVIDAHPYFANLKNLETSPITSVHLWWDRSATALPHVVLVDCVGQWVFNRGEVTPGEFYVQVVVSAARQFRGLGKEEVLQRVVAELKGLFPNLREGTLVRSKVITEHHATFSAVPGVDRWRPRQQSPIKNLLVAGDWTTTGWPATMEGAVRSGYLAAEALLADQGRTEKIVQPDLA